MSEGCRWQIVASGSSINKKKAKVYATEAAFSNLTNKTINTRCAKERVHTICSKERWFKPSYRDSIIHRWCDKKRKTICEICLQEREGVTVATSKALESHDLFSPLQIVIYPLLFSVMFSLLLLSLLVHFNPGFFVVSLFFYSRVGHVNNTHFLAPMYGAENSLKG